MFTSTRRPAIDLFLGFPFITKVQYYGFYNCVKFANENPVTYIATVGDQPRVRAFAMGFRSHWCLLHTGTPKSVYGTSEKPNVDSFSEAPEQRTGK